MTDSPIPIQPFQPRNLKMTRCVEYAFDDWKLHRTPKHEGLKQVSAFFVGRCARLRVLMLLPATISDISVHLQRASDIAELEITGTLATDGPAEEHRPKVRERWNALVEQIADARDKLRSEGTYDAAMREALIQASASSNVIASNPASIQALEASLMSYVTTSWTIIETMCGDLWETTLNVHPQSLANLNGQRNRLNKNKKPSPGKLPQSKNDKESKLVPLDYIAEAKFDIKNKMGSILKKRFEFSRLEEIREAYASAFDRDSGQIDHALSDQSLGALSAVRNVIVHRDGLADDDYLERRKYLKLIPECQLGNHIQFDGEIVVALLKPALNCANRLLIAVDDWLIKQTR